MYRYLNNIARTCAPDVINPIVHTFRLKLLPDLIKTMTRKINPKPHKHAGTNMKTNTSKLKKKETQRLIPTSA